MNHRDITMTLTLVNEWCDDTLFNLKALSESHPNLLSKIVNFDQKLNFNSEWKICVA